MGILPVGKFPKPSWKTEREAEKESEADTIKQNVDSILRQAKQPKRENEIIG